MKQCLAVKCSGDSGFMPTNGLLQRGRSGCDLQGGLEERLSFEGPSRDFFVFEKLEEDVRNLQVFP